MCVPCGQRNNNTQQQRPVVNRNAIINRSTQDLRTIQDLQLRIAAAQKQNQQQQKRYR